MLFKDGLYPFPLDLMRVDCNLKIEEKVILYARIHALFRSKLPGISKSFGSVLLSVDDLMGLFKLYLSVWCGYLKVAENGDERKLFIEKERV